VKFSQHFKLGKDQAELDFVDVDPERDLELYVDPYAIEIRDDEWSQYWTRCVRMIIVRRST
jgi:hypothetical protein